MKNKKLFVTILLIVSFSAIGFLNTIMLRTEDIGGWRHYIGIGAWLLAAIELVILIKYRFAHKSNL